MLVQSIWRTKPFVLLQLKRHGNDSFRGETIPEQAVFQQTIEEKALAAPPDTGDDLHIPVPHQPDKPSDQLFALDNHTISNSWVDIHLTFVCANIIPHFLASCANIKSQVRLTI